MSDPNWAIEPTPKWRPPLRALTLWPEWAWAIHYLDKRVENRTWALPRGEWFALHAGKHIGGRPGNEAKMEAVESLGSMLLRAGWRFVPTSGPGVTVDWEARTVAAKVRTIETSAILGVFRVTYTSPPRAGFLHGWRVPDQMGNVFEYRPLAVSIPCSGAQGLWRVPPDVAAKAREAFSAGTGVNCD